VEGFNTGHLSDFQWQLKLPQKKKENNNEKQEVFRQEA